jgi:cellobiose dehydrogenase (acceptor)
MRRCSDSLGTVPNLTLITPDNRTTVTDYVNNYPTSSIGSNHWVGSCNIGKVVDENAKVFNTTNLVSINFTFFDCLI